MSHTPGPWHDDLNVQMCRKVHLGPNLTVGQLLDSHADLLAACKVAVEMLERIQLDIEGAGQMPWTEIQTLQAAIDKATGEHREH